VKCRLRRSCLRAGTPSAGPSSLGGLVHGSGTRVPPCLPSDGVTGLMGALNMKRWDVSGRTPLRVCRFGGFDSHRMDGDDDAAALSEPSTVISARSQVLCGAPAGPWLAELRCRHRTFT
jgi:hypothetical protein